MKLFISVLLLLSLSGCQSVNPIRTTKANDNESLSADLLGTVDGCKIYRFTDENIRHYFVRCASDSVSVLEGIRRGKRTVYEETSTESK